MPTTSGAGLMGFSTLIPANTTAAQRDTAPARRTRFPSTQSCAGRAASKLSMVPNAVRSANNIVI